jgi:chromosome partitioning protein
MRRPFMGHIHSGSVITIHSPRGGAGRTTLTVHLAVALARMDARVCVLDLDPSTSSTRCLLGRRLDEAGAQLASALVGGDVLGCVEPACDGVDVLTGGPEVETRVVNGLPGLIRDMLATLRAHYSYVLIDTPARQRGCWTRALDHSDHVLVPVKVGAMATLGLEAFCSRVLARQGERGHAPGLLGAVVMARRPGSLIDTRTLEAIGAIEGVELMDSGLPDDEALEDLARSTPPGRALESASGSTRRALDGLALSVDQRVRASRRVDITR